GGSLADRLRRQGPLPWHEAARYVADVAEGLALAHARGIVHRDIKPDNILRDTECDEALLTDFGIAAHLTQAATVAGTPPYTAPEAYEGRALPGMDVFSLAATLFHLTTGEAPFVGDTIPALRVQAARGLPDPDTRCSTMPADLERVVRAGLTA